MKFVFLILLLMLGTGTSAWADRVKDLASVAAVRSNQLIGYGLVVGLQGTGDGADVSFTTQSMRAMLNRLGISMDGPLSDFEQASTAGKMEIKNVAAVMLTAELPGFAKPGQKIDVNVSAIGKATNLRGGNLVLTSLRGVDGDDAEVRVLEPRGAPGLLLVRLRVLLLLLLSVDCLHLPLRARKTSGDGLIHQQRELVPVERDNADRLALIQQVLQLVVHEARDFLHLPLVAAILGVV